MPRTKVTFQGQHGKLDGAMELGDGRPIGFALFAHCFTCGKDSLAATRISRELSARGIGVLRFDFTGIGGSEGDFANSDFSANIDDLVAAANYLGEHYQAPTLLIGHSLGGTAVLAAAERIKSAKAVVTIGAPANPEHLSSQFGADLDTIERNGQAEVTLAGRQFRIDRSFVDDLRRHPMADRIRGLRKSLLIMHSPVDTTVAIDEAGAIFQAALHPKSFVSLDNADHLLGRAEDAEFVASTIAGWSARYFETPATATATDAQVAAGHVRVEEENRQFLRQVRTDDHGWLSDEPKAVGGSNLGPDPYEQLLAALGTCTSMTLRMYANRKQWPLEDVTVELSHERDHGPDCERCEEPNQVIDIIKRTIRLDGPLDPTQRQRLIEIADRCPVHKTLTGNLRIETKALSAPES